MDDPSLTIRRYGWDDLGLAVNIGVARSAIGPQAMLWTMSDPSDWRSISQRLDEFGRGARARLAELLGMDRSQLARTLRREGAFPDSRQAQIIARFLGEEPEVGFPGPQIRAPDVMRVPEYGYAAASEGDRIALNEGRILDWADLPMGMQLRGEMFVVRAFGSSMEPRIWAGERKLVLRNVPPGRDQDAVIEFRDGTAVVKTYKRQADGRVFCHQYNPDKGVDYDATTVKAIHAIFPL